MDNKQLKGMSAEELGAAVDETRRALFSLRVNRHAQHVKDYSQFTKMRRTIARALTEMTQKKQQGLSHGK